MVVKTVVLGLSWCLFSPVEPLHLHHIVFKDKIFAEFKRLTPGMWHYERWESQINQISVGILSEGKDSRDEEKLQETSHVSNHRHYNDKANHCHQIKCSDKAQNKINDQMISIKIRI